MRIRLVLAVCVAAGFGASCRTARVTSAPATVQPGAPGQPSAVVAAAYRPPPKFTEADVKFMQGMIGHHQQALEMTGLIGGRTTREDMRLLGLRISVSQTDEIKMMQRWLELRRQEVPSLHAMHMHGATLMPGMLSAEEMAALAAAKGAAFERLFLQGMIKHHGGALIMVKELVATDGAGQDAEIAAFAADVGADQQMEIDRMRAMLSAGRSRST